MCNCDTGLTFEDVERLTAPLPLEDGHSVRIAESKETWAQWLVYTEEEPVIDRLNEIDPNWSFEITDKILAPTYVTVYGKLTIKGVSRACVGNGSPKRRDGKMSGDEEKGAATDALKRGARMFGIGLYLKQAPRIRTGWVEVPKDGKPEERREAYQKQDGFEAEALRQFKGWYEKQFGKPAPVAKQSKDQQMTIRGERGIVPPTKPAQPEPPVQSEPSELDAHFGPRTPRGATNDPTPEPDDPTRPENPVGEVVTSGGYDPATDMAPFTSTKFDTLRIHLKKIRRTTAHGHGTNAVLLAMVEAGMISEDERGGKDNSPQWTAIYGNFTVAQVWAAVEKHYAAKPVGKAS